MNHFPNSHLLLGAKDALTRNLQSYADYFGEKVYQLVPETYVLPEDYTRFQMARETSPLWILKPASLSCGRGIRLIGTNSHVDRLSNFVV